MGDDKVIVYIDNDYRCHLVNDGSMTSVEVDFFDGKCESFIKGYRYIPDGEEWVREDGVVFKGEMVFPWKAYSELDDEQLVYELGVISEYSSALCEIEAALSAPEVSGLLSTIVENRKRNIITCINNIVETLNTMSSV